MTMRVLRFTLGCLGLIGLVGCLPQLEDPPLTATGEAPDQWQLTGSGMTSGNDTVPMPTTCKGEYAGVLQDPAIDLSPPPCVVKGGVVVGAQPSAKLKALLSQVQSIQGSLEIHGDVAVSSVLPKLTALVLLKVSGGGKGKVFAIPGKLSGLNTIWVSNSEFIRVEGGAGLADVSELVVSQNSTLIAINVLPDVKTLGSVQISVNPMLNNVSVAPQATAVHALDVHDNIQLNSIEPFSNLSQVTGGVLVQNCPGLPHLYFLSELTSAKDFNLTKLTVPKLDLPKLTQVANLTLSNLDNVPNLQGMGALQVSQSVRLCVPQVACPERDAWLKQHAPGLAPLFCLGSETCKK